MLLFAFKSTLCTRSSDFLHICLYPTSSTVVSGLKLNLMCFFVRFLFTLNVSDRPTIFISQSHHSLQCETIEVQNEEIWVWCRSHSLWPVITAFVSTPRNKSHKWWTEERVQNMKLYTHVSIHSWIWTRSQFLAPAPCTWIMIQNNDRPHHKMHSWLSMMATQNDLIKRRCISWTVRTISTIQIPFCLHICFHFAIAVCTELCEFTTYMLLLCRCSRGAAAVTIAHNQIFIATAACLTLKRCKFDSICETSRFIITRNLRAQTMRATKKKEVKKKPTAITIRTNSN